MRRTSPNETLQDSIEVVTEAVGDLNDPDRKNENVKGASAAAEASGVQELRVKQTVVARPRPSQIFSTLLVGLPSPTSKLWTVVTFSFNVLLVALTLDMTYRAAWFYAAKDLSLARVGFVTDSSAKILLREPDAAQLPISLSYGHAETPNGINDRAGRSSDSWRSAGTVDALSEATDFTAVLTIGSLRPDTRYEFASSNNHTGSFISAPKSGRVSSRDTFRGKFSFLHTSCLKAHFPYSPLDHPLTVSGFSKLGEVLENLRPAFMLFLGDFIYVDVPIRQGSDVNTYRREYRQVYASPQWPLASSVGSKRESYSLPWLHVYDDHEIANDWSYNTTGVYPAAFDPFNHYHVAANPPAYGKLNSYRLSTSTPAETTYFAFTQGLASFFMLDTRRFRSQPNTPSSTMLGTEQLEDLLHWLAQPSPPGIRWKFVISSVPFTKNWRVNSKDTWAGYLTERSKVLEAMWDVNFRSARSRAGTGVVILSGDRHEFAATAFPPPIDNPRWSPASTVHEFSASPLSMFYLPIRTYREDSIDDANATKERDLCIKYIPEGNSKVGSVEIEPGTGSGQSLLRYTLFVDGRERWSHLLLSPQGDVIAGNRVKAWKEGIWS